MAKAPTKNARNSGLKAETEKIRALAKRLIQEGKAKAFLIEHGFATKGGRLTKRYGG